MPARGNSAARKSPPIARLDPMRITPGLTRADADQELHIAP
jgi:hypothetical protein